MSGGDEVPPVPGQGARPRPPLVSRVPGRGQEGGGLAGAQEGNVFPPMGNLPTNLEGKRMGR